MKKRLIAAALTVCLAMTVCACSDNKKDERKTVTNNEVSQKVNIRVKNGDKSLKKGESFILNLCYENGLDIPEDKNSDYTFSSSDNRIVSVDGNGKLTANDIGQATIEVVSKIYPGVKATTSVSVIPSNQYVSEVSDNRNDDNNSLSEAKKFAVNRLNSVEFNNPDASAEDKELFDSEYKKYRSLIEEADTPEKAASLGEEGVGTLEALIRSFNLKTESSESSSESSENHNETSVSQEQSSSEIVDFSDEYSTYSFSSTEEHFDPYTVVGLKKAMYYLSNIKMTDSVASQLSQSEIRFMFNVLAAMNGRAFDKKGEVGEFFYRFDWYKNIPDDQKIDPEKLGEGVDVGKLVVARMSQIEKYNDSMLHKYYAS